MDPSHFHRRGDPVTRLASSSLPLLLPLSTGSSGNDSVSSLTVWTAAALRAVWLILLPAAGKKLCDCICIQTCALGRQKKRIFLIFHPGNEHDFDIQSSRFHCLPGFLQTVDNIGSSVCEVIFLSPCFYIWCHYKITDNLNSDACKTGETIGRRLIIPVGLNLQKP